MPIKKLDNPTGDRVSAVNEATDVIGFFGSPLTYKSSDLDLIIDYYTARDLPDSLKEWTYDLVKSNMYTLYANSKDGWNEAEKRSDMGDEASRYLIARDRADPGRPVGFVMFQFVREETMDDEMVVEVAYCYELQVTTETRGKGLGAYLMRLLEDIGRHWNMEKVMLTVFRANTGAYRFYKEKLGFELDEISPSACLPQRRAMRFDYEIMSKKLSS